MICRLCPRECGVDRRISRGFCGMGEAPRLARAALHQWEEPCISGDPDDSGQTGSGTVFFSGCVMRCVFCQNHDVSAGGFGKDVTVERLADIFIELQQRGAYNINLVSPTPFVPQIIRALDIAKPRLTIPVVYNTGGYERVETLRALEGYVDIYLPDVKYYSDELAVELSQAPHFRYSIVPFCHFPPMRASFPPQAQRKYGVKWARGDLSSDDFRPVFFSAISFFAS